MEAHTLQQTLTGEEIVTKIHTHEGKSEDQGLKAFVIRNFEKIDHLLDRLIEDDPSLKRLKIVGIVVMTLLAIVSTALLIGMSKGSFFDHSTYLQYLYVPAMLSTFAYGRKTGTIFAIVVALTQIPFSALYYLEKNTLQAVSGLMPSMIIIPLIYWVGLSMDRYRDYLHNKRSTIDRLRVLSQRVITRDQTMRKNLAAQIHDHLLQSMVAALFKIEKSGSFDTKFSDMLRSSINEIRLYVDDLRQSVPKHTELNESLDALVLNLEEMSGAKVHLSVDLPKVSREDEELAYNIIKEATSNIWKHAQANYVSINIKTYNDIMEVYVIDDGIGFKNDSSNSAFGISIMKERLALRRGGLSITSGHKRGTVLTAKWRLT